MKLADVLEGFSLKQEFGKIYIEFQNVQFWTVFISEKYPELRKNMNYVQVKIHFHISLVRSFAYLPHFHSFRA
jgi:hypothetical protein